MSLSFRGKNFHITSDWHFNHARILMYCRRLDFMNDGELRKFLELENKIAKNIPIFDNEGKLLSEREAWRSLRYSKETIDRMNSTIIDNCNAVAGPDDSILMVGDVIFGEIDQLRRLRERIICRHLHLIFGNHDKDIRKLWHRGHLRDIFETAQEVARIYVDNQPIWVSHYAHLSWEKRGTWHCYAHSHGNLEQWREENLSEEKMIDIGIDYRAKLGKGYTPWSYPELKKYMDSKKGFSIDHHHS